MWIAVQSGANAIHQLWPILYLTERRFLAMTGGWMLGDVWVAMKQGPVPLRTFLEFCLGMREWPKIHPDAQLDGWLMWMAQRDMGVGLHVQVGECERECLKWAVAEFKRLGTIAIEKMACGRAWQLAGPSGELDPLEVALEGGADAATLDCILNWRGFPNLPT